MPMLQVPVSPDQILKVMEQFDEPELDELADKLQFLRAKRRAPSLSPSESSLMLRINEGLSPSDADSYLALTRKERGDSLDKDEHEELIHLTDQLELAQARRLNAVLELARLRQVDPEKILDDLGLCPAMDDG